MDANRDIRILLVDDDAADVERTLGMLRRCGLEAAVQVARGGQEALDHLFGRGQFQDRIRYPLPDLIFLDLNMPVVDGYAVLRQVRQVENLKGIQVIVLCMSEEEGNRAMAYDGRANSYLVKGSALEKLEIHGEKECGCPCVPARERAARGAARASGRPLLGEEGCRRMVDSQGRDRRRRGSLAGGEA